MELQWVIASAGLINVLTVAGGFLVGSRKRKAETLNVGSSAAENIAEAYKKLNDSLASRIATLERRMEVLEIENSELALENENLKSRIRVLESNSTE